jgi:outer membrane receptor protein involved in Fe transport
MTSTLGRALVAALASASLGSAGVSAQSAPAAPAQPAQPVPAAPAKPAVPSAAAAPAAPEPVVTIQGERPANRIDRQVYDQKGEAGATNNSAADALGNVPSVTVDPDGTVSLRGSTNVQILVDGKPSAMLQGEGRGAALNAMPSNDIESIEVINNPGAQFGNDGGGGPILNLVMRRNRTPGGNAVISANVGPNGRANSSVSGSYQSGAISYQGGVHARRDGRNAEGETERERIDPVTGVRSASSQRSESTGLNNSVGVHGGVTYNVDDKTSVAAQLSLSKRSNDQNGRDSYSSQGADYVRSTSRQGSSDSQSLTLRLDRKGSVAGETLKFDLRLSSSDTTGDNRYVNQYADPANSALNRRSRQDNASGNAIADFSADYERPVEQGIVKLGVKLSDQVNSFDTSYFNADPVTGRELIDAGRSNMFEVDERNLALYGSYQRRLNERWGVLGGMRVEHTGLEVHQRTSGIEAHNSYTNYIPSMFLTYKASDTGNLRLSYAHRIRRPNGNDLNPFIVYRDEFNVSAGNPQLGPSESDSLELGYETKFGVVDTNLRAFFRNEEDVIVERSYFVADNVLLTTRDNGGKNRSAGLEFALSGKLTPKLSFNTSGNLMRTEQRATDALGSEQKRSGSALSLRARVSYQPSAADQIQLTVNGQGKALTGQGYREPSTTANLSLRHVLTPRLSLVMNVTDIFDANKTSSVIDTAVLRESSVRRFDGRLLYLGLSYRLGGVTQGARPQGPRGPGRPEGGGMMGEGGPPPG